MKLMQYILIVITSKVLKIQEISGKKKGNYP